MESVILTDPVIIIGFIISLVLCIFAIIKNAHAAVSWISVFVFVSTATYALLSGADLYEVGAVATVFFIINLIPKWKKGGDK